jgi:segregation and condensation protein B
MEKRMTEEAQEAQEIQEAEAVEEPQAAEDAESQTPDEEGAEVCVLDQNVEPTVESVVEAVLFASDEPLADARLADIVETSTKQVRECIESLNTKYRANNSAFRIEQIAGGNQMLTLSLYNYWLKKLLRVRSDNKLSPAALETLAIIAYKQPVMRADIEAIRGVAVGEVIRSLSYKGLVKIVGRAEVLGRPMLYGTTRKFLEVFGLNNLKDLPKVEELKKPRE